jgi:branched-subunit amino acid transport protein
LTPLLLLLLGLITYGSRAAAVVFLPRPTGRVEEILGRMPAPIFASLATLALITPDRTLLPGPVLVAALGALIASPRRSLAMCLVGGLLGYVVGRFMFA